MSTPNNPPAFPMQVVVSPNSEIQEGMSLRDWFAGGFAQEQVGIEGMEGCDKQQIAAMAYELADAMLAEREKGQDE